MNRLHDRVRRRLEGPGVPVSMITPSWSMATRSSISKIREKPHETIDAGPGRRAFVLLGILALGWLSVRLGKVDFFGGESYTVTADFPSTAASRMGRASRSPA